MILESLDLSSLSGSTFFNEAGVGGVGKVPFLPQALFFPLAASFHSLNPPSPDSHIYLLYAQAGQSHLEETPKAPSTVELKQQIAGTYRLPHWGWHTVLRLIHLRRETAFKNKRNKLSDETKSKLEGVFSKCHIYNSVIKAIPQD